MASIASGKTRTAFTDGSAEVEVFEILIERLSNVHRTRGSTPTLADR
jgi:hypothetical protein